MGLKPDVEIITHAFFFSFDYYILCEINYSENKLFLILLKTYRDACQRPPGGPQTQL